MKTVIDMIRSFLKFVGINMSSKQPPSTPYLYGADQTIIEEYDDIEVIGMWGCFDTETGESEIKGKMMGRTVKFKNADGSVNIDQKWYPDKI
jgi:hypothetical protein